jgi:hypothetical protein
MKKLLIYLIFQYVLLFWEKHVLLEVQEDVAICLHMLMDFAIIHSIGELVECFLLKSGMFEMVR